MKNFFKNNWASILLIIILIVISVLSFIPGKYLLSNDNYSPELNPLLTIQRALLSPAWRSYRVLGFASDSEQADIFRTGILGFMDIFLPNPTISQVFSLLSVWVGTLSIGSLAYLLVNDFIKIRFAKISFLISGVLYLTTLWTAWVFNFNMMPYITQFGFLPLVILTIYLLFKNWSNLRILYLLIALLLFTSTSVIATLFFVDIVLIVFFIGLFGFLFHKRLKKIILTISIVLVSQLFWLLPFVGYTLSASNNLIDSYTNRSITASTIDLEKGMMTMSNSARFFTRLLGTTDDPNTGSYIFPFSSDYSQYDFYKVIGYLPLILSILGLIFVIVRKKYSLIPLWVMMLGCLFLLKNQNEPLGGIYIWLQNNIPMFKEVFRWVSSKLLQPYLITLILTAGLGFILFADFLGSFLRRRWEYVPIVFLSVLICVSSFFYAEYLFSGDLFTRRALVSLPEEYSQLQGYLKEDTESRIYYAPPSNNGYFREYSWGFVGSQFLGYIIPNPLMDMSLSIGSSYGETAMLRLQNLFEAGKEERFTKALLDYDVKYVLVDRSLVEGRYGHELNWEVLDAYISKWELVWQEGDLELYKLQADLDKTPILSTNIDVFDENIRINSLGRYINKTIEYQGKSIFLTLDPREIDKDSLPTNIFMSGDRLFTSPSIPIVEGLSLRSEKDFGNTGKFDYLIVSNYVFPKAEIIEGITVDNQWGKISSLYTVKSESFKTIDLTTKLSKSSAGDCSGDEFPAFSNVVPEKIASGFLIEGTSALPCVHSKVPLDSGKKYVAKIVLNWESGDDSLIGICLYSNSSKRCLNKGKYFNSKDGYGNAEVLIPELISNSDDLSLSVYAFNPIDQRSKVTVRKVLLNLSESFAKHNMISQTSKETPLVESVITGDDVEIKIPIIHGRNSYIYNYKSTQSLWALNKSGYSDETYKVYFKEGMTQEVYGQNLNQYENVLETFSAAQYLWVWEGDNLSNIPASVCLTYQGDDKCWIDDVFYDDQSSIVSRLFAASSEWTNLDASYNSPSYATETINVLKQFIVMNVPDSWLNISYDSSGGKEYIEIMANNLGDPTYSTFYSVSSWDIVKEGDPLLTIPQAEDSGWLAVTNKLEILKDKVTVNGWKQGWDISDVEFNNIYVIYWPNFLGYLGYILLASEVIFILVKIFKHRKYERK